MRATGSAPRAVEWPPISEKAPAEKNQVSATEHHRPKGWEAIVDNLARSLYVTSIRREDGRRGSQSRIYDSVGSDTGISVLVVGGSAPPLGLRVSTTARNAAERDLVLRLLARTVKL